VKLAAQLGANPSLPNRSLRHDAFEEKPLKLKNPADSSPSILRVSWSRRRQRSLRLI